jgi:hypothetical protein
VKKPEIILNQILSGKIPETEEEFREKLLDLDDEAWEEVMLMLDQKIKKDEEEDE